MKALCVLYGGRLENEAFQKVLPGNESAFSLALAAVRHFPRAEKFVLFGIEGNKYPGLPDDMEMVSRLSWTRKSFLEELSRLSVNYDFTYVAWADCPLLDPALAALLAERHIRYGAEYTYADGWPYGFAPELLAAGTAGILAKLSENDESQVERDALFQVIQKDINAFDIETEISPSDLRPYRLTLAADSKRNLLLLSRLLEAGLKSASDAEKFINEKPELLRTLPAFFNIQVSSECPQVCSLCPWPIYGSKVSGDSGKPGTARGDFMSPAAFASLLDTIAEFAGDAVIDLSLWGELSLHPERLELVRAVLSRPALSLVIETSGIGWKPEELLELSRIASQAAPRKNHMAPLSWIVSLDAYNAERYKEIRGSGFSEARSCAKTLLSLFPEDSYVQAVRVKEYEDDIEHFYRSWKSEELPLPPDTNSPADSPARGNGVRRKWTDGRHIIIQKYDDFAGALPRLQASDLSPVKRRPCWHILRDMIILLDGSVPCCREDLGAINGNGDKELLGNALTGDISDIWERGAALYKEHCICEYKGICKCCDEYYTYNF